MLDQSLHESAAWFAVSLLFQLYSSNLFSDTYILCTIYAFIYVTPRKSYCIIIVTSLHLTNFIVFNHFPECTQNLLQNRFSILKVLACLHLNFLLQ